MKCARHEVEMVKDQKTGLFHCKQCNNDAFLEQEKYLKAKKLEDGDPEELDFEE